MSYQQANVPAAASSSSSCGNSLTAFQNYSGTPKVSDAYCMAKVAGPNATGETGSPCAVAQNNVCVPGVVTNGGACQTSVQQDAWAGWGPSMPNTYLISTSGPQIGVTMGGCNVRPIGSPIQNYVGFFDSCQPKPPTPQWGRQYSSDFAAPNYSSCG